MPNIAFQMIVFNGDYVLEPCLKAIMPYGPVYVTEGPVQYYVDRGFTTSVDRTNEILHDYLPEDHIVHGQWSEKDEMVNAVVDRIPQDTSHVWWVDSDEVWKDEDIRDLVTIADDWDSISFKMWSFYGGFDRYITGFEENFEVHRIKRWHLGARWETHRPPTVRMPNGKLCRQGRHLGHRDTDLLGFRFYHYSMVFPSQMEAKIKYYEDYDRQGVIPNYIDEVWRPWLLGDDETRGAIEEKYNGIHNWLPKRRGPSFTKPFEGQHPQVIQDIMPDLLALFDVEAKVYYGNG